MKPIEQKFPAPVSVLPLFLLGAILSQELGPRDRGGDFLTVTDASGGVALFHPLRRS